MQENTIAKGRAVLGRARRTGSAVSAGDSVVIDGQGSGDGQGCALHHKDGTPGSKATTPGRLRDGTACYTVARAKSALTDIGDAAKAAATAAAAKTASAPECATPATKTAIAIAAAAAAAAKTAAAAAAAAKTAAVDAVDTATGDRLVARTAAAAIVATRTAAAARIDAIPTGTFALGDPVTAIATI